MLIDFTIENYRSIRERQTLSMERITRLHSENEPLDTNVQELSTHELSLLKSVAIYGANASGKSNIIHAMRSMKELVVNSAKESQVGESIKGAEPFAFLSKTRNAPSIFEIRFVLNDTYYRYGYEATTERIEAEWLFKKFKDTKEESELFVRSDDIIEVSNAFKEGQGLEIRTRDNALFLSVCAQFSGEVSQKIIAEFFDGLVILKGIPNLRVPEITLGMLENRQSKTFIMSLLNMAGTGIVDIKFDPWLSKKQINELLENMGDKLKGKEKQQAVELLPELVTSLNPPKIQAIHKGEEGNIPLPFEVESEGTQKLFALAGPIFNAISRGQTIVIDEFDARLHPILAYRLIELFHELSTDGSQLIFTTHDTNLMKKDLFLRDQVWFTEKDNNQETKLYSLAEFKGVRQGSAYAKNYIQGRFGAIPFMSDFDF